jgi:hypothetical protein
MSCLLFDTYVTFGLVTWDGLQFTLFGGFLFARTWVLPPPCPFSPPFVCCWVLWFIDDLAGFHHLTSSSYVLIYMHNTYTFLTWSCKTCNFYLGSRAAAQSFQNYFGDHGPIKVTHCAKNKKGVLECITTI